MSLVTSFARFGKRFASGGASSEPTDIQADAGLEFLGTNPPTFGLHNSMFQWLDDKDNWFFSQLRSVLLAFGVTPAADTPETALLNAIRTAAAGGEVGFSSAGAFSATAPSWARLAEVTVTAGGGGGAGCFGPTSQSGGGGGAGASGRGRYTVTGGLTYNGVVGAGGTGGGFGNSAAGGPGGNGGTTSFSSFLSAAGGSGGRADGGQASGGLGGRTVTGHNLWGDIGGDGGDALGDSTTNAGSGGGSHWGGGGRGAVGTGLDGNAAGAGGGGAYRVQGQGGAGANGRVMIKWLP
jgi:hypothetical protein